MFYFTGRKQLMILRLIELEADGFGHWDAVRSGGEGAVGRGDAVDFDGIGVAAGTEQE